MLGKEHKAASFKLLLVLIKKKKIFAYFASLLMARSCFSKKEKERKRKISTHQSKLTKDDLEVKGERLDILALCPNSRQFPL